MISSRIIQFPGAGFIRFWLHGFFRAYFPPWFSISYSDF